MVNVSEQITVSSDADYDDGWIDQSTYEERDFITSEEALVGFICSLFRTPNTMVQVGTFRMIQTETQFGQHEWEGHIVELVFPNNDNESYRWYLNGGTAQESYDFARRICATVRAKMGR